MQQCQHQGMNENIRTSAMSSNQEERIKALKLLLSQTDTIISDILMDIWVEGSELQDDRIPTGRELDLYPEKIVNDLTWAILRQFSNYPQKTKSLVEQKLKKSLLKQYLYVCNFCLGEIPAESFLQNAKDEQIALVARAGGEIELLLLLEYFRNSGLDRPIFAWILIAKPPILKFISELLKLDKEKRAVFGLCAKEEWLQLSIDIEIKEQIIVCQRSQLTA